MVCLKRKLKKDTRIELDFMERSPSGLSEAQAEEGHKDRTRLYGEVA